MIRESSRRRRAVELAGVTLLALAALASLWSVIVARRETVLVEDERDYLRAAVHLARDGVLSHAPIDERSPRPDAYREPGYPLVIAAAWRLSGTSVPNDENGFARAGAPEARAERAARTTNALLLLMAAGAAALAARRSGVSARSALVVAAVVLSSPALGRTASQLAAENLATPLVTLAGAALVARVAGGGWRWLVVGALAAGLAPLTRAATLVLLPAATLVLVLLPAALPRRERLRAAALFTLIGLAPPALWLARNQATVGHAVLADRGGQVLWTRAELDRQIAQEGLAPALLSWTPLQAAASLREDRYPDSRLSHYAWTGQGNFFTRSLRRWRAERADAEDPLAVDAKLGREALGEFLARPGDHLRATVAVAWRGLFAERSPPALVPIDLTLLLNLGLALGALAALVLGVRRRDPRLWALAALPLALFVTHALGTEFLPRFSVPSLPLIWAGALVVMAPRPPRAGAPPPP